MRRDPRVTPFAAFSGNSALTPSAAHTGLITVAAFVALASVACSRSDLDEFTHPREHYGMNYENFCSDGVDPFAPGSELPENCGQF
ncbi:MAG: hypothetical protein EXR75_03475 [Myxococcales bacterium]|nr:hypothetical protein [Myxococcales bacterium]